MTGGMGTSKAVGVAGLILPRVAMGDPRTATRSIFATGPPEVAPKITEGMIGSGMTRLT